MNKILERAIAKILYNLIKQYFDDIESIINIQKHQDYNLIIHLENLRVTNDCDRDVDYDLIAGAWKKFSLSIEELNKNNDDLISHILKEFDAKAEDTFIIAGTLYNHEKIISIKLSTPWINKYKNYIIKLDSIICDFRLEILRYETANVQDVFFAEHPIIQNENIKFQKSSSKGNTVYLDMNAVQPLANVPKIKKILKRTNFSFVYSTYLIEDALNSNPLFLNSFYSDLYLLTNGEMVGYMNDGLCYVKEKLEDTVSRVSKYSNLTKLFEYTVVNDLIKNHHVYPELRKGRKLNQRISSDIIGFFNEEAKKDTLGFNHVASKFHGTSIEEFVYSGKIVQVEDYETAIEQLSSLFDFVNFGTEDIHPSNYSKIASSFRDRKHLEHAYICDYLVTDDSNLKKRAEVIYEILGIKTKIIGINDFKKMLKQQRLQ